MSVPQETSLEFKGQRLSLHVLNTRFLKRTDATKHRHPTHMDYVLRAAFAGSGWPQLEWAARMMEHRAPLCVPALVGQCRFAPQVPTNHQCDHCTAPNGLAARGFDFKVSIAQSALTIVTLTAWRAALSSSHTSCFCLVCPEPQYSAATTFASATYATRDD